MTKVQTSSRQDANALMNFSEYNTFQGFYKITSGNKGQGLEHVFNKCILVIIDWIRSRIELNNHYDASEVRFLYDYPEPNSLLALNYDVFGEEDFHLKRAKKQFDIAILAIKEFGEWTIRLREPNNKTDKGYLDWLFTTDVALKMSDDYVFLAIRTKCKESHDHEDKAIPYRVKFLRDLLEDKDLVISEGGVSSHNYLVNMKRLQIERSGNAKKDDYEFLKVVKDPGRQMPIIFCPAILNEEDKKDEFRIRKLSEHMSGEAYVVIDEQHNGYKDLFKDRMTDILKQVGLTSNETLEQIKSNYLYLEPMSETEKFKWFPLNPAIDEFKVSEESDELGEKCEKAIRNEIENVESHVYETFHRRNDTDNVDYNHGDTLYYSDLWNEYINNSDDSKRLEEAIAAREAAEQRLKELTESHEADIDAQIDEVVKGLTERLEEGFSKDMKSAKARFEEQVQKKDTVIEEMRQTIGEKNKKIEDLEERLRKNYDYRLENEKLVYLNSFWSKPYKRGSLTEWVTENMSDLIIIHKDAATAYKKSGYPMEDIMRNAFIFLYADEMKRSGAMRDELYNAVHADKSLSGFGQDRSGGDGEKHRIDGQDLDQHITYSEHNAEMFRIYYCRDKETGKALVGYIKKHL